MSLCKHDIMQRKNWVKVVEPSGLQMLVCVYYTSIAVSPSFKNGVALGYKSLSCGLTYLEPLNKIKILCGLSNSYRRADERCGVLLVTLYVS
jgi:hypothetical protein